MPYLDISVKNKIAVAKSDERIVCNNSDYGIRFDFDAEWEAHALKTVQFRWFRQCEGWKKHEEVISGDECPVPMIDNARWLYVGVYAGDLRTTTEAEIGCRLSALSGEGVPHDPPEDVYNQIMERIDEAVTHSDETAKEAKEAARSAAASAGSAEAAAYSAVQASATVSEKAEQAVEDIRETADKAIEDISLAQGSGVGADGLRRIRDIGSTLTWEEGGIPFETAEETLEEDLPNTIDTFGGDIVFTGSYAASVDGSLGGEVIGAGTDASSLLPAFDGGVDTLASLSTNYGTDVSAWMGLFFPYPVLPTKIRIALPTGQSFRMYGSYVQGSSDGRHWVTLASYTGNEYIDYANSGKTYYETSISSLAGAFRYFRYFNYNDMGTNRLSEFQVFGIEIKNTRDTWRGETVRTGNHSTSVDGSLSGEIIGGGVSASVLTSAFDGNVGSVSSLPVNANLDGVEGASEEPVDYWLGLRFERPVLPTMVRLSIPAGNRYRLYHSYLQGSRDGVSWATLRCFDADADYSTPEEGGTWAADEPYKDVPVYATEAYTHFRYFNYEDRGGNSLGEFLVYGVETDGVTDASFVRTEVDASPLPSEVLIGSSGYRGRVYGISGGKIVSSSGWLAAGERYAVDAGLSLRLVVCLDDFGDIAITDAPHSIVRSEFLVDGTLTVPNAAADAAVVGAMLSNIAGAVVCSAAGEEIPLDIAAAHTIPSMHLFGKSTQSGTPYLFSQSVINGVGEGGSVNLTITGDGVSRGVTIPLSSLLHGVPTAYSGNYTDASGQSWVADEIDLVRGVLIRRTGELRLTGDEAWVHEDWIPYSGESLHATVRLSIGSTTSGVSEEELCTGAVWAPWRWEGATANSVIHYRDNMLRLGVRYDVLGITQSAASADKLGAVVARLKAAGTTVVRYALASPVEEPLPDGVAETFRSIVMPFGASVIRADGAWVDMRYVADTKAYVDKRFDELAQAILGNV